MTDEQKKELLEYLHNLHALHDRSSWADKGDEKCYHALRRLVEAVGEWQREAKTLRKTYIGPAQCLVTELRDFNPFEEKP